MNCRLTTKEWALRPEHMRCYRTQVEWLLRMDIGYIDSRRISVPNPELLATQVNAEFDTSKDWYYMMIDNQTLRDMSLEKLLLACN